jgi:hypothetical protein
VDHFDWNASIPDITLKAEVSEVKSTIQAEIHGASQRAPIQQ